MKKVLKKVACLGIATIMACSFTACKNDADNSRTSKQDDVSKTNEVSQVAETPNKEERKELSGTITLAGSTSMEKLANAIAEAFMEKNPAVTVTAEFTGSSAGVEALLAGSVNIGNASRGLKDSEISSGAVENVVAIDGIAIVLNPNSKIIELTKQQLIDIYTGAVTNWSELGGRNEPIVVVGREAGSGTRGAFEEILKIEGNCKYALELDSTGTVVAKVASTNGAIGYVSLDMVNDTVIAVSLEGIEATAENINAGSYFLARPFVMATNGEISAQSEEVQALFEYISSSEGKALIESVGLITAD